VASRERCESLDSLLIKVDNHGDYCPGFFEPAALPDVVSDFLVVRMLEVNSTRQWPRKNPVYTSRQGAEVHLIRPSQTIRVLEPLPFNLLELF